MNTETQKEVIEAVLGNPVRSSMYGLAGERRPLPYACADDNARQAHIHISSHDEASAISRLLDYCHEWYPSRTSDELLKRTYNIEFGGKA
jgi:hypothetical protein